MESYELGPDKIINWAVEYADYDDLESTAKSLYSIYVTRRKREFPQLQKAAQKAKKKYRKKGWTK